MNYNTAISDYASAPCEGYVEPLVYCPDVNKGSCAGMSYPEGPAYDGCIDTGNIDPESGDEIEREAQRECGTMWGTESADGDQGEMGNRECNCGPWKTISIVLIVVILLIALARAFLYFRNRKKKTSLQPPKVRLPRTAAATVSA